MRRFVACFTRRQISAALALWLAFSGLTLWIVSHGLDRASERPMTVTATTLGVILGPMTGAISRDFQGCCLVFSLSLLPWCLAALAVGVAVQLAVEPKSIGRLLLRWAAWLGGWLVWFGGGIVSFGHALS